MTLEGIPLVTGPLIPVAYVLVGVSTVDQAGNEGPISPPVAGAVAHAVAPATPAPITPDAGAGPEYASRADYHGRSRYTLTIGATEPGLRYDLYRALDASILALAGKAGETVPADPDDATLLALAGRYPDAFTRLETRDGRLSAGAPLTGDGGAPELHRQPARDGAQPLRLRRAGGRSGGQPQPPLPWPGGAPDRRRAPPGPGAHRGLRGRPRDRAAVGPQPRAGPGPLPPLPGAKRRPGGRRAPDGAGGRLHPGRRAPGATAADLAVGATAEAVPGGRGQLRHADGPFPGATEAFYRLVAVDRRGERLPALAPGAGAGLRRLPRRRRRPGTRPRPARTAWP